jgi:hypothetical protein
MAGLLCLHTSGHEPGGRENAYLSVVLILTVFVRVLGSIAVHYIRPPIARWTNDWCFQTCDENCALSGVAILITQVPK